MKAFGVYLVCVAVLGGATAFSMLKPKRTPGKCMPYAETCLHCSDCSTCVHCSEKGGKCSVCFKK